MVLAKRIKSFEKLGEMLQNFQEHGRIAGMKSLQTALLESSVKNTWFTPGQTLIALNNLGNALSGENLNHWLSAYESRLNRVVNPKKIGVVMAGNIPAVGFHDFLCVLLSGHMIVAKLSSSDDLLIPAMAKILMDYMPDWQRFISFTTGTLQRFDAIIATGSTNTSRFFEYYFSKYPHIIRKNRNSIAVLSGKETKRELQNLADDIMLFFGMGCRSVSKIFVPTGYDFSSIIEALEKYNFYSDHHKYRNNYDYYKSIFLVSQIPCIDTGFILLREESAIASPISVLHYEYYDNMYEVEGTIMHNASSVQCVISNIPLKIKSLKPGEGQKPALWDYPDNIDTMEFLLSFN
jgi:hypothetical protein